eukprot:scaffold130463_cov31-Tisochrysis_lutea.AAC.3
MASLPASHPELPSLCATPHPEPPSQQDHLGLATRVRFPNELPVPSSKPCSLAPVLGRQASAATHRGQCGRADRKSGPQEPPHAQRPEPRMRPAVKAHRYRHV